MCGAVVVAGVCAASAVPSGPEVEEPVVPTGDPALVAYDSCDTAATALRRAILPHVTEYGLGGPYLTMERTVGDAAPPTARTPEHSTTNRHEAAADEPDLVKTDGRRVVSVVDGRLRVLDVASGTVAGLSDLPGPATGVLLHGDRALVFGVATGDPVDRRIMVDATTVTLVDLSGPPRVLGTLDVDARFVDARQVGDVVRVVVHSAPNLPFGYPDGTVTPRESLRRNQEIAASAPVDAWLPRYRLAESGARSEGALVACDRISHPDVPSATSLLTVLTFDFPGGLGTGDAVTVLADGDTVYGTGTGLYVADARGAGFAPATVTAVHRFDVSRPGPPVYAASGEVPGVVLNQYSLSEHDGLLRVATTLEPDATRTRSSSTVTVLRQEGDKLVKVGAVDGLGHGERVYSVRFAGPVGYVVTFRQTDPLYTLDLSDPAKPRVTGELKITGYSAYLHPAGDGRLLGIGQEADERGRVRGTQVSLFDVTDPEAPTRLAAYHLPGTHSEAEFDPHAFLYRAPVLAVPVGQGVLVLDVADRAITARGTVSHPIPGGSLRSMVIGDELWTVSHAGVRVNALDGLAERAWIPFS